MVDIYIYVYEKSGSRIVMFGKVSNIDASTFKC